MKYAGTENVSPRKMALVIRTWGLHTEWAAASVSAAGTGTPSQAGRVQRRASARDVPVVMSTRLVPEVGFGLESWSP